MTQKVHDDSGVDIDQDKGVAEETVFEFVWQRRQDFQELIGNRG